MQHIFWLIEDKIAGRSGPSKDPWDLKALKKQGIDAVLSVNDGEAIEADDFTEAGVKYQCIPFARNAPPEEGDLDICIKQVPKALAFIRECEREELTVLIHCHSGKDRTGLIMAYLLMDNGAAPLHAVNQVRGVRDSAFSAEAWDQFVFDVLYALQE
ncbi:phosphatase domain-containing protein [Shewanella surugensis]|uniref:Dual specificity protein phosphatase family protein n=1 Tax=Shewanella surugensis TaxID=212020 RepID=A0ABT0LJ80_9GAMM|nr:dual specificity protein phosphatase family protein [Shewanella surugensis]MCL1127743.1 dual specificity protein phosphatase family protein [Shewanella surugensis]